MQQRQCFTQGENVELLAQYGLFLAKIATVVVAIAVIAAIIVNLAQRKKQRGELRVTNLSEHYKEMKESLAVALLDGPQQKQWHKAQKKKQKQEAKAAKARAKLGNAEPEGKPRAWVLDFKGSMDAHEVNSLREEITAVLAAAKARDQGVIRLESPGGGARLRSGRLSAAALARQADPADGGGRQSGGQRRLYDGLRGEQNCLGAVCDPWLYWRGGADPEPAPLPEE